MCIDQAAELADGLAFAMSQSGPFICEVRLQPNEALSPKVAAMPQEDGSMLSMPLEDMSPLLDLFTLESEMLIPLTETSSKVKRA